MKNDAYLGTIQVSGPCIMNKEVNQHSQGQDDKAEKEEHPFLYYLPFQHMKKEIKTTTLNCKPGMYRPLGNTMELNPMMEVAQNLNC